MKKIVLVSILSLYFINSNAQSRPERPGDEKSKDTISQNKNLKKLETDSETAKYTDYKIISANNDTTVIDTTLTLKKDFKLNYLRKDNFELLPFHNQGQTFNKLGYSFENNSIFPTIGVNAKQFNYYKVEDIKYYYVPTATSELTYRNGLEQGQFLNSLFTFNTSKQLNFSIEYKGLRSLGKYLNALSSHGNFRSTFSYHSKNNRYFLKGHFSSYDLMNQENGGLTDTSVTNFESGNSNYIERARLDVNYTDAESMLEGKRYYINQAYTLYSKKTNIKIHNDSIAKLLKNYNGLLKKIDVLKRDTLSESNVKILDSLTLLAVSKKIDSSQFKSVDKSLLYDLSLGNTIMYETEHYRFTQTDASDAIGDAYESSIADHTSFQKFNTQVYAQLDASYLGSLKAKLNYFNYNYHYNSILFFDDSTIGSSLKGYAIAFGAEWSKKIDNVYFDADASTIIAGDITGTTLKASVAFKKANLFSFKGFAEFTSKTPNFNTLLYQSDYEDYNWQNDFSNEEIKNIGAEFTSEKWGTLNGSYNSVINYTYFDENSSPTQAGEVLNYFKLKASKDFSFGKFTLDNTLMLQKVVDGESYFKVPSVVTRNSFYYSDYVFQGKPLYLQTGITFKYFTKFNAGSFDPLINEFVLQNDTEIGNYPIFDFFVNAQIRRTRMFFKVENFTASLTGRNYFAAPNYPYRDLTVRFGLVWNFFN